MSKGNKLKALIIAPSIFPPANISSPMAKKVAKYYSKASNIEISFLEGILATRIPMIARIKDNNSLIIYMGHGNAKHLCGDSPFCDGFGIQDADLLKDKIICSAPACEVGKELAPTAIKKGAKAFIAATTSMYGAWKEKEHDYYKDWKEYFGVLYTSLLTKTVSEALDDYKHKATEFIEIYKSKEDEWINAEWYLNATYINRDHLKVFGDPNARVSSLYSTNDKNTEDIVNQIIDLISPPF